MLGRMRRKVSRERVVRKAKDEAEHRKLYSFRMKEDLMDDLKKDAQRQKLSVTGLLEAMIKDYLEQS